MKNSGVNDISIKLYPDARHEILNEINKNEVQNDIIQWIEQHL
jgi:alpha-beta hydrolase superfamily lysophospholipase